MTLSLLLLLLRFAIYEVSQSANLCSSEGSFSTIRYNCNEQLGTNEKKCLRSSGCKGQNQLRWSHHDEINHKSERVLHASRNVVVVVYQTHISAVRKTSSPVAQAIAIELALGPEEAERVDLVGPLQFRF